MATNLKRYFRVAEVVKKLQIPDNCPVKLWIRNIVMETHVSVPFIQFLMQYIWIHYSRQYGDKNNLSWCFIGNYPYMIKSNTKTCKKNFMCSTEHLAGLQPFN